MLRIEKEEFMRKMGIVGKEVGKKKKATGPVVQLKPANAPKLQQ